MLKKSLNDLCINPFNEFNYTWPILIAGDVNNGYNGMTVSWGGLGTLWGKPVGFVFVRKASAMTPKLSEQYTEEYMLKKAYNHEAVITLDEMPDLKTYPISESFNK
jgi:hypothetical protein